MAKRKRLEPGPHIAPLAAGESGSPALSSSKAVGSASLGPPIAQVAGDAAQAAALARLSGALAEARADGRLIIDLPLGAVRADHLTRDRLASGEDDEDMAALRDSLRQHGQRTPIEVMARHLSGNAEEYGLISGWRRLSALRGLHAETGEARFATIRALIRQPDGAAAAYVAMVEENEIRVGLSYFERARVVALTADQGVFVTDQAALRALFANVSRAKRSKIGSFVRLYRLLGEVLRYPVSVPERLGLRLIGWLEAEGAEAAPARAAHMAAHLGACDPGDASSEQAALDAVMRGTAPGDGLAGETGPKPQSFGQELGPGMRFATRLTGQTLTVTIKGESVDPDLQARLETLLRQLKT